MIRRLARPIALATAIAAAGASLAGCASIAESAIRPSACEAAPSSGAASDAITAAGAFGEELVPSVAAPVSAETLQVARSGAGSGQLVTRDGVLEARVAVASAVDGAELVGYESLARDAAGADVPVTIQSLAAQLPGAADALQCAQAGERLLAAMPASELFGSTAGQLMDPAATVIFAADVLRVYPSSASGVMAPPENGIPAVVTAPSGRPGVTMPQSDPPTEARAATRLRGFGRPIEAGQRLTLHVAIFDWATGEELASTWEAPNTVLVTTAGGGQAGVDGLYGATRELAGRPEGSQLVVIVPTEQALSEPGPVTPAVARGKTLVLILDVLAADEPNAAAGTGS